MIYRGNNSSISRKYTKVEGFLQGMAFDVTMQIIVISRPYYEKESKTLESVRKGLEGERSCLKLLTPKHLTNASGELRALK